MLTEEEYNAKCNKRYENLIAAAEKAQAEGRASSRQASEMASMIPMGQPILVGHYSEGRDRNYRNRIDNKYRKGYELAKRADELKSRAASIANNDAIYADDPTATKQLAAKISELEARQIRMKATNKAIKTGNRAALVELGHAASLIDQWLSPEKMPWPGKGYASFELTNNNAKLKAAQARLKQVSKQQATPDNDEVIGDIKVEWRASENRIRVIYPARVDRETFAKLKAHRYRAMQEAGTFSGFYNRHAAEYVYALRRAAEGK